MAIRVGILIGTMSGGGAQRVALDLLEHLRGAGIEPFLISVDRLDDMRLADRCRDDVTEGRVFALSNAETTWSTPRKALAAPRQWLNLRNIVRELNLDVMLSLMERANILNLLGARSVRKIISVHSHPRSLMAQKSRLKRALVHGMYSIVLPRADRMVFVSREAALDAPETFPMPSMRTDVIYNMCDPVQLANLAEGPLPAEHEHLFESPVVITCGRLIPDKGHDHLIRAMRLLRDRTSARLVILGDGPLRDHLNRLIRTLDLQDRVVLAGFQGNPMAWMARARVFALPSHREGLPMALLEAMAAGTAVVAADCSSGPREILAPYTDPRGKATRIERVAYGVLVPPMRPSAPTDSDDATPEERELAAGIEELLENDDLRDHYENAGRRRAREFAPANIIPQWTDIIREVLEQREPNAPVLS